MVASTPLFWWERVAWFAAVGAVVAVKVYDRSSWCRRLVGGWTVCMCGGDV
jgi:hypothetical protein